MERFVESVFRAYFGIDLGSTDIEPYLAAVKEAGLAGVSPAGGWIHFSEGLPKLASLPTKEKIWTGLVAEVGGCEFLDILAYTDSQGVTALELAAPLDDFPSDFSEFKFKEFPS